MNTLTLNNQVLFNNYLENNFNNFNKHRINKSSTSNTAGSFQTSDNSFSQSAKVQATFNNTSFNEQPNVNRNPRLEDIKNPMLDQINATHNTSENVVKHEPKPVQKEITTTGAVNKTPAKKKPVANTTQKQRPKKVIPIEQRKPRPIKKVVAKRPSNTVAKHQSKPQKDKFMDTFIKAIGLG